MRILDAYERATSVDRRGAVMLDGEMIDEASRKLALAIVAKGRAAGLIISRSPPALRVCVDGVRVGTGQRGDESGMPAVRK